MSVLIKRNNKWHKHPEVNGRLERLLDAIELEQQISGEELTELLHIFNLARFEYRVSFVLLESGWMRYEQAQECGGEIWRRDNISNDEERSLT